MFKKPYRSWHIKKTEVCFHWLKEFIVTGQYMLGVYLQHDDRDWLYSQKRVKREMWKLRNGSYMLTPQLG